MTGSEKALRAAVDAAPVIDPHTHLRPARPEADNLADIVLYHHVWIELVSAGMPVMAATRAGLPNELADPGMPPLDRLRAALPYLGQIRTTTCAYFLRTMLGDLYGVPGGELRADNLEAVSAKVEERAADPDWRRHLLQNRCLIEKSLTVGGYEQAPWSEAMGKGVEVSAMNLVSGKRGPRETLAGIEEELGKQFPRPQDYGEAMFALGQDCSQRPLHFVGLWILPYLSWLEPSEGEVAAVLAGARAGRRLSQEELSIFSCYGLRSFLHGLRTGRLRTIQLMVGAQVLVPHRSITHWSPELPETLARLAAEFEDFHFNCTSAADLYTQDLAILAKHVPNVSVAGYWWHTLYPGFIRKSIEARLDIVPASKIVAFFSDAYHAEWCYPKVKLVKRIFADILLERVQQGVYTPDMALGLARQLFYENPKRIYGVQ